MWHAFVVLFVQEVATDDMNSVSAQGLFEAGTTRWLSYKLLPVRPGHAHQASKDLTKSKLPSASTAKG